MGKPKQKRQPIAPWLLGRRYLPRRAITFGAYSAQRIARTISVCICRAAAAVFFNSRSMRDIGMLRIADVVQIWDKKY